MVVYCTPRPLYHPPTTRREFRYALNMRLGGPQSRYGRFEFKKKLTPRLAACCLFAVLIELSGCLAVEWPELSGIGFVMVVHYTNLFVGGCT
jgi:hypothetical protein